MMTALEMAKRNTPAKAGRKEWGELFLKSKKSPKSESVYEKTNSTIKKVCQLKDSLK